jgi:cytochrome c553
MKTFNSRLMLAAVLAASFPAAAFASDADILSRPDVQAKIQYCKDCHGASGQGFNGVYPVPRLAGQMVPYLETKFEVITEHRRDNATAQKYMKPVLGSVDPAILRAVATYFSNLKVHGCWQEDLRRGREGCQCSSLRELPRR